MKRNLWTLTWSALALLVLLPVGAGAQDIPAGPDVWSTPNDGGTYFTIPEADIQTLCPGFVGDATVVLKGSPLPNQGTGDTVIDRLDNAVLAADGDTATVRIRAGAFNFVSAAPVPTPCGDINFTVNLDGNAAQPQTLMTIVRESAEGGVFDAEIQAHVVLIATDANGNVIGHLFYWVTLPQGSSPSPWSYTAPSGVLNPGAPWFPGVGRGGTLLVICRGKLLPAFHCYKIAKKKCKRTTTTDGTDTTTSDTTVIVEPCAAEPVPTETEPTQTAGTVG